VPGKGNAETGLIRRDCEDLAGCREDKRRRKVRLGLQSLINSQPSNGTLQLPPGEYFGQVTIDRPMTIVAQSKGTWIGSQTSPTIRITSLGVKLQNLMVEITTGPDDVAIEAATEVNPILENVQVRGRVVGVPSESVITDANRDGADKTQITFLPPPPISAGALSQEAGVSPPSTPVQVTTHPGSVAPGFRSKLPWLKFMAVGTAVLVVGLAVGGYFFQQRSREIAQLQEAARLRTLEKQRMEKEKQEKQREIERLKALELERERLEKEKREQQREIERLKAAAEERERREKELPAFAWNYPEEVKKALRLAIKGRAAAQYNMGVRYYKGKGVPKDYVEAVKWWITAARQDHVWAQFNLGIAYDTGKGVPKDHSEAVKWFKKAAEQGIARAQARLGVMYALGRGVPRAYSEAVKWYKKAAEQGNASAQANLGLAYVKGHGVNQDFTEAVKWSRKAADQGNSWGQNALGFMYEKGYGMAQDSSEAVKWYKKAAEQGNAPAQSNLGVMYVKGRGVPRDYSEAVKWFKKAAEQGHANGQASLGVMYARGYDVPKDRQEAIRWLRKAASQGLDRAKKLLRKMGEAVP